MKIAITAEQAKLDAPVDPRFGRAKVFAIYDTETGEAEFIENTQNLNAPSGAGVQAATNVVHAGAKAVLTGNCGPKAFRTLAAGGVRIVTGVGGTVREAAEKFARGECTYADAANVEGHW